MLSDMVETVIQLNLPWRNVLAAGQRWFCNAVTADRADGNGDVEDNPRTSGIYDRSSELLSSYEIREGTYETATQHMQVPSQREGIEQNFFHRFIIQYLLHGRLPRR